MYIILGFMLILLIAAWVMISAFMSSSLPEGSDLVTQLEAFEVPVMVLLGFLWFGFHVFVGLRWKHWYAKWDDLLKAENKRLQDIEKEVSKELEIMQSVTLLSCDKPELPPEE